MKLGWYMDEDGEFYLLYKDSRWVDDYQLGLVSDRDGYTEEFLRLEYRSKHFKFVCYKDFPDEKEAAWALQNYKYMGKL